MQEAAPQSTHGLSLHGIDRSRLDAIVEPLVRARGAEVFDVEFKSEPNGWVLRIYVEKLGSAEVNASTAQAAVDLDLCSSIAREVSPALDVADLIPHRYSLEVSSPGIERPLRRKRDFVRFAGQKAKLKLGRGVRGQKVLVGILGAVEGETLTLVDGNQTYEVPLEDITFARLVFEFGPASHPKPGHKRNAKHR
jgi:ribosome maturation factor RimP